MKIVFLGENDWANTCNRITCAINRHGGEMQARAVTVRPHKFDYSEDVVIERDGEDAAREAVRGADWIISSGDGKYDVLQSLMARLGLQPGRTRLATRHAGTAYRSRPHAYDRLDTEWGFERRFMACDLYRFVVDDPRARVFIQPQATIAKHVADLSSPLRLSHTPSRRASKGTDAILPILAELTARRPEIEFDLIENVSFEECYRRRNRCHVLIDQLQSDVGGFGSSAMEALANGLAVVSYYGNVVKEVERWIPLPPIANVSTASQLMETVLRFMDEPAHLALLREHSLRWAQQYLTPAFTYQYWWRCLNE